MMRQLLSIYLPSYPTVLVYMLQESEYKESIYLRWVWRTKDYSTVMKRRTLVPTKAAGLLLLALRLGIITQLMAGAWLIYQGYHQQIAYYVTFGAALMIIYPIMWAHLLVVPVAIGRWFISGPTERKEIAGSEKFFVKHKGLKIAVAGSYGKTSMKELLKTVLGEGLKVAATPANKNVSVSHARWAKKLKGDEDVLIIEYGEGEPGDVARFAGLTHPTHAVITGLAPAHLDRYPTLQAAGDDIFSVAQYVDHKNIYVNGDSPETRAFIQSEFNIFNSEEALGWKISHVKTGFEGTAFRINKGRQALSLKSGLVGRHQVGFLAFAAALALELGLSETQVKEGIAKTVPFEHRMQPYQLNGAWIIDDTYNGNLEGIRAGTQLLKDLPGKRKIYVTPGLVDQGVEIERVHVEIGKLIAAAGPDIVILMQDSVTGYIKAGLAEAGFRGELRTEDDALDFYTNLQHFVAAGDLVVMQNDWTDFYNQN